MCLHQGSASNCISPENLLKKVTQLWEAGRQTPKFSFLLHKPYYTVGCKASRSVKSISHVSTRRVMSKWIQRGTVNKLQVLGRQIRIHKQSAAPAFKTVMLSCNHRGPELHSCLQMRKKPRLLTFTGPSCKSPSVP